MLLEQNYSVKCAKDSRIKWIRDGPNEVIG